MSSSTEQRVWTPSPWLQRVEELGFWKMWLSTLSPERLAQQRQYDKERSKKWQQEHKEELKEYKTYSCNVCSGKYNLCRLGKHVNTSKHKTALALLDQQQKDALEQQRQDEMDRRKAERSQKLQEEVICDICRVTYKARHASRHIKTMVHVKALSVSQEVRETSILSS
jgi:tRNA nucleotidyltransferase/poly(A) polymerase